MERWRKPAHVIDIEEDPAFVYDAPDGRTYSVPKITVTEETKERIRLGYLCALCFEPFERAWPEVCPFCNARVRDGQGDYFAKVDRGVEEIVGALDLDTEIEIMREQLRREGR